MADAYGSVKSNPFKVKDFQDFKSSFYSKNFIFGNADIIIYTDSKEEDGTLVVMGDPDAQYPDVFPTDFEINDRLEEFISLIRNYMVKDEIFCLMAQSNEKLMSQVCSLLIITQEKYKLDNISPDMDREYLFKLLNLE